MADSVGALFAKDAEISKYYNTVLANGKWNHMMDQTHIGYTYWQQPPVDKMPDVTKIELPALPQMGVDVEGSASWWPQEKGDAVLPGFYRGEKGGHYIEIFNKGQGSFKFTAKSGSAFVRIKPTSGSVTFGQRLWVTVDWAKLPKRIQQVPITITGDEGSNVIVEAVINAKPQKGVTGFFENNGYISIEAVHFTKAVNSNGIKWQVIPDYGKTLSGVMPSPVTAKGQHPGGNSPHLEYEINLTDTGRVNVEAYISPTIDFTNTTGLRYAISIDDEQPQIVNINADKSDSTWRKNVADNIKVMVSAHHISEPGKHLLKYWMVDPAVVLQKIVVNAGGEKPSYLGPPESYNVKKAR